MTVAMVAPLADLAPYGQIAGIAFIAVLIVWIWRRRPVPEPEVNQPIILARFGYGQTLLIVFGVFLSLFLIAFAAHPQLVLVVALTLMSGWLIVVRRDEIAARAVGIGLGLAGLCMVLSYLSGRLDPYQAFYLACIPVLFVGGTLLTTITGLGRMHSVDGDWGKAATGFLGGCLLALPAAMLNVSFSAHAGDTWVNQVWEPAFALVPGIAEETWARLFMLTSIYAMLLPKSRHRPARALLTAVLIAALVHALSHLPAAMVFSPAALQAGISAVLFGVPMGLIFARFGFEAAVGYHFFIDFVRFAVALLAQ
jgi:hypothetical protein